MTGVLVRRVKEGSSDNDPPRGDNTVDKFVIQRKGKNKVSTGSSYQPAVNKREILTPDQKRSNEMRKKLGFDPE